MVHWPKSIVGKVAAIAIALIAGLALVQSAIALSGSFVWISLAVAALVVFVAVVGHRRAQAASDLALADAERAMAAAERTGNRRIVTVTRIRLAHVHQWREEFTDSNALFAQCLSDVDNLPDQLRSFVHQHAGKNFYDQRRYAEAAEQFAEALRLREGADPELVESSRLGLQAARQHLEQAS